MKKKEFLAKIKQFETQNWICTLKIHISNPWPCEWPKLIEHAVGSKQSVKMFDINLSANGPICCIAANTRCYKC